MNLQDLGALIGKPIDEEVFAPMEAPTQAPSMESSDTADASKPIRELFDETPFFDEAYIAELEHHVRTSVAVRSAIKFALQTAREDMIALRSAETMTDVARHQGSVTGLEKYFETIITMLENPPVIEEEPEDELEE